MYVSSLIYAHICIITDSSPPQKMAKEFLKARTKVPTRPHVWAPHSGSMTQKAVDMSEHLMDKVRSL